MKTQVLVLATTNPGKVAELREMLGPAWVVKSMADFPGVPEVDETEATFAGNAELKAGALCAATGELSVGDDSGLCVDALNGGPGVYSARYALTTEARIAKLLGALAGVADRSAHFECALCAVWPDGRIERAIGLCTGRIGLEPRGHGGFGYDPVFELGDGRTMAELSQVEKAEISHRGAAFRALVTTLSS